MDIYTFYAQVQEIAPNSISVEGLSLNEEPYRGVIQYDIWAETSIVRGSEVIQLSDLKQGDIVAITLVTGGGNITDIFKIQVLQS